MSPEVEAAVAELMAISSQSREACIRALTAAQGIPDVAFEFLLSGNIPEVSAGGQLAGGEEGYGDEEMADEGEENASDVLGQYNLDPETM